jgi:alkylhydroperoxidase family enzyme
MAVRIPRAEVPAELRDALIARLGSVPDPIAVAYHHPPVAQANSEYSARVAEWDVCDAGLKTYAHMAVAARIGCSWCLDINHFLALNQNLDPVKASQVPNWRRSTVFDPLEREVLAYAEAMTDTPTTVTDEMSAGLLRRLGAAALVELTTVIAFANMASRSNTANGITSQGYSDHCGIPSAERAVASGA